MSATVGQWVEGARPRTLPAAFSPVIAGSGLAVRSGSFAVSIALLTLLVSVALQIGVNYANDYSDGIRGTDADRVGPLRLVGSGLARPAAVKAAAFISFGIAALAGLAAVIITGQWWLLAVGAACVLAAWYYTGGKRPYGYAGLGEIFVFVFFGLVAVCGTVYLQSCQVTRTTVLTAIGVGSMACAILVANNLRDIVGDSAVGKRTLATRLGDRRTRVFYVVLIAVAAVMVIAVSVMTSLWALLGLIGLLPIIPAVRTVLSGGRGLYLIPVLKSTGAAELLSAVGLAAGLAWSYLMGTSI